MKLPRIRLWRIIDAIGKHNWEARYKFKKKHGYPLNLKNPQTFSEKIQWRKLKAKPNLLYTVCADKLKVRDYVEEKIGAQYLIPLLYQGCHITKQQLQAQEGEFVVKANHNSGPVQIVMAENNNLDLVVSNIEQQLQQSFGTLFHEYWYDKIERKVLVERLLRAKDGALPEDYKFHVFNNKGDFSLILQVDYNRHDDHNRSFYDAETLENLPFSIDCKNYNIPLNKPENYREMLTIAKKLTSDFEYCRVDLYNIDGQIYFGELTFSHGAGFEKVTPTEYDHWLGEKWVLPD